jgi:hypothetical protein
MKITPVASPAAIQDTSTPESVRTAKAVAAFNKGQSSYDKAPTTGQAQETAVANPNAVSAEELSAVKAPSEEPTTQVEVQTEAPEAEAVTAPEQASEKKPDPKASQEWARLARQERQLRARAKEQEAKFLQREEAIKAREAEAQSKSEFNQKGFVSIEELKRDILGVAERNGIAYDELAQQMMNPTKLDPRVQSHIDRLQAKIDSLEKTTQEGNERLTKQQQDAYNTAVKQIETDVRNLVKSDPNFETVSKTNSVKDVVELITKTYEKDGILLTVDEAATEVENYLIDEALKLTKIEKIKRKLSQPPANGAGQKTSATAATKGAAQPQKPGTPGMKTLTNTVASTRKLSAKERAILAFRGELK